MKPELLLFALAAPASLVADEPAAGKSTVTQESLVLLKQTFTYQPTATPGAQAKKEPGSEIITMAPFIVSESLRQRELSAKLERDARKKKDEEFTPVKGGTILESGRLKIGAWPDPEGWPPGFKLIKIKF